MIAVPSILASLAPGEPGEGRSDGQAELAGRLDVTQGAISKLEHSEEVRISTLRQDLEALGARLELVAVFEDEERRVPVHLGKEPAASSSVCREVRLLLFFFCAARNGTPAQRQSE